MKDPLCEGGEAEIFKGFIHLGLFGLGVTCAAYNAMAWSQRRENHLLKNVIVYGALAWYEGVQISRHLIGTK